jgi:hypothetical protein
MGRGIPLPGPCVETTVPRCDAQSPRLSGHRVVGALAHAALLGAIGGAVIALKALLH